MFEAVPEFAALYLKVGGIIGFGIGALAQVIQGKSRDWTFQTCLIITVLWPLIFVEAFMKPKL